MLESSFIVLNATILTLPEVLTMWSIYEVQNLFKKNFAFEIK